MWKSEEDQGANNPRFQGFPVWEGWAETTPGVMLLLEVLYIGFSEFLPRIPSSGFGRLFWFQKPCLESVRHHGAQKRISVTFCKPWHRSSVFYSLGDTWGVQAKQQRAIVPKLKGQGGNSVHDWKYWWGVLGLGLVWNKAECSRTDLSRA